MTAGDQLAAFIQRLSKRDDVLAIILFGSQARGDARPDSDIDLVVILRDGYARTAEYHDGRAFEIVWVTEAAAIEFWDANPHDAAALWQVARILHDRDGTGIRLRRYGDALLEKGPPRMAADRISQLRFDAEDVLRAVAAIERRDPATAALLLQRMVGNLIETFLGLRAEWIPPPKQRLAALRQRDPVLAVHLDDFFQAGDSALQSSLARNRVAHLFDHEAME